MLGFAGFLGQPASVALELHKVLSEHEHERLVHLAYVRPDGRMGSFCAPGARAFELMPEAQCALLSNAPMTDGVWDAPPIFAALTIAPQQSERSHYALEGALLARIASVFLQRGLDMEAALSRTLDKFPAAMSTLFLLRQDGVPTLVATRRGPPIWLRQTEGAIAIFGDVTPPAVSRDLRPVEIGDTVVVDRQRLAVIDIDGMRMEKISHLRPVHDVVMTAQS